MPELAGEVVGMVLNGKARNQASPIFRLETAAGAHRAQESRKTAGAAVLQPQTAVDRARCGGA